MCVPSKADFSVFYKNSFDGIAQIVFKQVSTTLIRILFYYSAHFLNLTLIKHILYFVNTNKQLSVLKIYGCILWWLMTVSAFQFQMHFRGLELAWKINCRWKAGTTCSYRDQPGALLLQALSGTAARGAEWGVEEERKRRVAGGKAESWLFSELSTNRWSLSGGEMQTLLCLMNTVSGQKPEFPALH